MMKTSVSLRACQAYERDLVNEAIEKSLSDLGGLERFFQPGETVFLKVNLLMARRPEEVTTTHPLVVEVLAQRLIAYGCKVIIGDSPGGPFNLGILRRVYRETGMAAVAEATGAILNENVGHMERKFPEGVILKNITLAQMLKDVDHVVSVCKLKTHGMTKMTGATKNLFGCIPGTLKAEYHFKMPDIYHFSDALIDICACVKPTLSVMDAVIGMEGEGPSSGNPKEIGAILTSKSAFHMDMVAARIMGLTESDVPMLKRMVDRGLVKPDLEDVDLLGDPLEMAVQEHFDVPDITNASFARDYPKWIRKIAFALMQPKPVYHHDMCIGCRICEKACPPKAITMVDNRPLADLDACIRCFCCAELCPEKAISVYRPPLMKLISKL
jgi:uncharacterized protein (DUF362 family)/Pyruvate/2-oxoacid:ferredoxin oxidoreductase delta subunit